MHVLFSISPPPPHIYIQPSKWGAFNLQCGASFANSKILFTIILNVQKLQKMRFTTYYFLQNNNKKSIFQLVVYNNYLLSSMSLSNSSYDISDSFSDSSNTKLYWRTDKRVRWSHRPIGLPQISPSCSGSLYFCSQ